MARSTIPVHMPTLLACSVFASKEENRPYLCGVYVEARDGGALYCATDGHRLLARFVENEEIKVSDFMIVPASVCKLFKLEEEKHVGEMTFGAGSASIFYNDVTVTFEPVNGTFPHFGAIVPSVCSGEPAQFNGKYVADFDKVAKIMGAGEPRFDYNGSGPAAISFNLPDVIGVLMPMTKSGPAWERPAWLDRTVGTGEPMKPDEQKAAPPPADPAVADNCLAL